MSDVTWIYGKHPVLEWLKHQPEHVLKVCVAHGSRDEAFEKAMAGLGSKGPACVFVSRQEIERQVGKVTHQGVMAQVKAFAYAEVEDVVEKAKASGEAYPLWVALDHIQDPHNVGAVIRSAHAMGAVGILIPKDRACEITPVVMKSSAGAAAHVSVCRVTNLNRALEGLKEQGYWVVGLAAEGEHNVAEVDLQRPLVLLVGSEGTGLAKTTRGRCDYLVRIPMRGKVGSLNASVACGMALYEIVRQQDKKSA